MATVQPQAFLTLHYRLCGGGLELVNTFSARPATITLGAGMLAPALENCLREMQEGERKTFQLPPGAVFGEHHADKLQWVAGSLLDTLHPDEDTYTPGDVVQFPSRDGQPGSSFAGTVLQVEMARVLFDFNHPLAGQEVEFEAHVLSAL